MGVKNLLALQMRVFCIGSKLEYYTYGRMEGPRHNANITCQ